ncbi:MAG: hypothetical protein ABGX04_05860 [Myxococcales bacterium]|nr:hypothetical protein [Myxococcales bacterium]HIM01612.1 hypothetical protein [Myxococcales bacterium]
MNGFKLLNRLLFIVFLAVGWIGCAAEVAVPLSRVQIAGANASTIIIAPMNVALPLPDELESSTEIVMQALSKILRSHGKSVQLIDSLRGRQLWLQSAREVQQSRAENNFENAVQLFARKIGEMDEFDVLILPSLYVTNAQVQENGSARWDTANQKVEFIGQSKWEIEVSQLSSVPAASILMSAFDRDGRNIHSKRTGLELVQHLALLIETRKGHDKRTWALEDDVPAISDPTRVEAAVSHSLFPFLPKRRP